MKLLKANIKNYQSIKNTTIKFEQDVTVLAGKNEAGKTSILKALYDMNYDRTISDESIPIDIEETTEEMPSIGIELEYDLNEIEESSILKEILEFLEINTSDKLNIKLIKHYPKEYSIFIKTVEKWNNIEKIMNEKISKFTEELKKDNINIPDFDENKIQQIFQNLDAQLKKTNDEKIKQKILKVKESIHLFKQFKDGKSNIIQQILPNFILFESFRDTLPDKIPVVQATNNEIVKDFFNTIKKDEELKRWTSYAQNPQKFHEIMAKVKEFSAEIFGGFLENYEEFELLVERGGNNYSEIWFLIREPKKPKPYKIGQRSEGLRWWLSLNIRIRAKIEKDKTNIILIDEPSLYLHISAQKKAMEKIFEVCKKGNLQIIYTTHSPYMLPAENLEKIRIVEKKNKGTEVKLSYETGDKDTLTPILVAIGANVLSGLSLDCESYPIVVEGITDYLYLKWSLEKIKEKLMSEYKNSKKVKNIIYKINIIPTGGGSKSHDIGIILWYMGFRPFFIFDGDKTGKAAAQRLRDKLYVGMDGEFTNIFQLNENNPNITEIEDWFAQEIKEVVGENSFNRLKKKKGNHVIKKIDMAKKVINKDPELSEETEKRTMRLFKKIIEWFLSKS